MHLWFNVTRFKRKLLVLNSTFDFKLISRFQLNFWSEINLQFLNLQMQWFSLRPNKKVIIQ